GAPVIAQLHIAQQEDPLPGHQYIIEEDDGIHLLESAPQRVVEVGTSQIETLPAEKFEARSVTGDSKGEGVTPLRIRRELMVSGGVHGNLVGQRPQGS